MEAEFVQWLRQRLPVYPQLPLGIGDDAAVVRPCHPDGGVVTTDLLCDGIHFQLASTDPGLIGRKALAVSLSDLAAMAAIPEAAFVSLLWPRSADCQLARQLYEGLITLADSYQVAIAGGDTNRWDGSLVINVALLGSLSPRGPLRRRGAQVGDAILVTGQLGGSVLEHHLTFEPRLREARLLHDNYRLHAGIDLSDGLGLDLSRLLSESQVGAVIETAAVPISAAAETLSRSSGRPAAATCTHRRRRLRTADHHLAAGGLASAERPTPSGSAHPHRNRGGPNRTMANRPSWTTIPTACRRLPALAAGNEGREQSCSAR